MSLFERIKEVEEIEKGFEDKSQSKDSEDMDNFSSECSECRKTKNAGIVFVNTKVINIIGKDIPFTEMENREFVCLECLKSEYNRNMENTNK